MYCRNLSAGEGNCRRDSLQRRLLRALAFAGGSSIDIEHLRLEDRLDFIVAVDIFDNERSVRRTCDLDAVRDPALEITAPRFCRDKLGPAAVFDDRDLGRDRAAGGIGEGVDAEADNSRALVGARVVRGVLGIDARRANFQAQVARTWIDKHRIGPVVARPVIGHRRDRAAVGGSDILGGVGISIETRLGPGGIKVVRDDRVLDLAPRADHAAVVVICVNGRERVTCNRTVLEDAVGEEILGNRASPDVAARQIAVLNAVAPARYSRKRAASEIHIGRVLDILQRNAGKG